MSALMFLSGGEFTPQDITQFVFYRTSKMEATLRLECDQKFDSLENRAGPMFA